METINTSSILETNTIKQTVASILNVECCEDWAIVDRHENLVLVHYEDDANMTKFGNIRGILVDIDKRTIVAKSFGYTPKVSSSDLSFKNGELSLVDEHGTNHKFPQDDVVIKRVFEGVTIRVIYYNNVCYKITHKRINAVRSRWGSSETFLSMYDKANGPTVEQLFDTTKSYSSTCYYFLIVDPSLLVATRQKVLSPYIVFLDKREMDEEYLTKYDSITPGISTFSTNSNITGAVTESFIHSPKSLSIDEANAHLKYGYYNKFSTDDERQLTGEAVIVYSIKDNVVKDIVKVHSISYDWRFTLRGNNPNINNQFYNLLNKVYPAIDNDDAWNSLTSSLIILPLYDEESIKQLYHSTGGILTIPTSPYDKDDYMSRDARIHLLWLNFLVSLPMNIQSTALDLLSNFINDKNAVISWLQQLESSHKKFDTLDIPDRAKALLLSVRDLAKIRIKSGKNYSSKGSYMKTNVVIKTTIRNLINKENGTSLYGLVRHLKRMNKEALKSTESTEPTEPTEQETTK